MKPELPFPIEGPFLFHPSGKTICVFSEKNNFYSLEKLRKPFFRESECPTPWKLFLNSDDLYFYLKKERMLENFILSNWKEEIYHLENSWIFDEEHELSDVEIHKFDSKYRNLSRIKGLVDWDPHRKHKNNDLVRGFKNGTGTAFEKAIDLFDKKIESGWAVAVMPSHKAREWGYAGKAGKALSNMKNRIDCSEMIYRFKSSPEQRPLPENARTPETHYNSIRLNKGFLNLDKKYCILDDVITTGTSLNTVKVMVELAGIEIVRPMALGNTLHPNFFYRR